MNRIEICSSCGREMRLYKEKGSYCCICGKTRKAESKHKQEEKSNGFVFSNLEKDIKTLLRGKEWDQIKESLTRALKCFKSNISNTQYAQIHLWLLMADMKVSRSKDLSNVKDVIREKDSFKIAFENGDKTLQDNLEKWASAIETRISIQESKDMIRCNPKLNKGLAIVLSVLSLELPLYLIIKYLVYANSYFGWEYGYRFWRTLYKLFTMDLPIMKSEISLIGCSYLLSVVFLITSVISVFRYIRLIKKGTAQITEVYALYIVFGIAFLVLEVFTLQCWKCEIPMILIARVLALMLLSLADVFYTQARTFETTSDNV